jgi:very-short-patch-repair endonuclease
MSRTSNVPAPLTHGPFLARDALAAGLLSPKQLTTDRWRQIYRGVFVLAAIPDCVELRAQAARLIMPPGAVLSGRTAAYLLGVDICSLGAPLEITVPREATISARPGVAVRRALLPAGDVGWASGLPVTVPARTAFDLGRRRGDTEALVALDALVHAGLVEVDELRRYLAGRRGWRGVRIIADRLPLVEAGAESPMETRLRLVLIRGGLPRPAVQVPVLDQSGQFVARPDMSYPEARLGIEYDGRYHAETAAFVADRQRLNRLLGAGWRLLHYTADDVYRRPAMVVAQVRPPSTRRS